MELRTSYAQDLRLVSGAAGWTALIVLLGVLAALPLFAPRYVIYVATLVGVHGIVAVGLNLLMGYAGQVSLGHAGFVAIGAYAHGLFLTRLGWGFGPALVAAAGLSGLAGSLLGLPALRLAGPYLAVATLGFGLAVHQVLVNWEALSGGRSGLFFPEVSVLGGSLRDERVLYWVVLTVAVFLVLGAYRLVRSYIGRAFVAIRDSEISASTVGIHLTAYKTLAFGISALYAGAAGALLGHLMGFLEPQLFTLFESIYFLAMVVVGGLGSVSGSLLGAVLLTLLPQALSGLGEALNVVYGLILLLVLRFDPGGLYARWLRIRRYWKAWPL
ncbi:MAG: branched-chain amino acid ABC transporter permease [Armatimonadota bacterium]|nr:branched-chain amino acid ABC transporter permease [Armatimonadota bacterium]MDR7438461.1 branched-chain amino acid ABC transporter permease [Armatimonadota bacterium]MDR7563158.1 branched-chain amino acid ABC transporter permease [Armatimonadota bacterium]MDR7602301.1 branched-chain amino acid ABC transporter permease [Armatimonadota bacterium]